MPYSPSQLSRLTPGEIGRDQAVIDYFYYGPDVTIQEVMSKGFFDKAGYLFFNNGNPKTWERISILAQRGYGTSPKTPERYSAVVSDVTVTSSVNENPTEFEVTLSLGPDTSYSVDDNVPAPVLPWHNFFIKYQGICRYTSFATPGTPVIIDVPSNYTYSGNDFCTAVLFSDPGNPNQPAAGDAIVAAYVEAGPTPGFPLRVRLITPSAANGHNQRAWVTVMSSTCKFA